MQHVCKAPFFLEMGSLHARAQRKKCFIHNTIIQHNNIGCFFKFHLVVGVEECKT
jgi:hypothetical protein